MVKINVRGKEIEISEELIEKRNPPCGDDPYPWGEWSTERYEKALTLVQRALETLDNLKNSYHAKELSQEQLAAELKPFQDFSAFYTRSVSARGRGEDHADEWLGYIVETYDFGGIVRKTIQEIIAEATLEERLNLAELSEKYQKSTSKIQEEYFFDCQRWRPR